MEKGRKRLHGFATFLCYDLSYFLLLPLRKPL